MITIYTCPYIALFLRKKGLEDVRDKDGNIPIQYLSGRTPISAIKALEDFDAGDGLTVSCYFLFLF